MKNVIRKALLPALLALIPALSAQAGPITTVGGLGGSNWRINPTIVGQTSTHTLNMGGDPIYVASMPRYSGVVALAIDYAAESFVCSGSLLPDRRSILTAAHCVSPTWQWGPLLGAAAFFYGGPDPDTLVPFNPAAAAVSVSGVFVHPEFTGIWPDHNDIAVLRLAQAAPDFAVAYGLSPDDDLTGDRFNVAGYGLRSDTGGAVGANLDAGILRQGDNRYEFRLGDSAFDSGLGNLWSLALGLPLAQIEQVYLADFDNGLEANDASCLVTAFLLGLADPRFCDLGVGALEVGVSFGDSGGPQFGADGLITSISSFILSPPPTFGDHDEFLQNSSWGEFIGFVPVHIHRDFIAAHMVPAPGTMALVALGLLAMVSARRRGPCRGGERLAYEGIGQAWTTKLPESSGSQR